MVAFSIPPAFHRHAALLKRKRHNERRDVGDRGNIVVRQDSTSADDVWFYTHWSGFKIGEVVREALAKNWRWEDASYLARIIFDTLTSVRQHGTETGFGISTRLQDNEYPIVVVDVPRQKVWTIEERQLTDGRIPNGFNASDETDFADYVKQPAEKAT